MRDEVRRLVERGQLPDEGCDDLDSWTAWELAAAALSMPATDEEALAVLDVLPATEASSFGIAWTILHFAESAPGWPPPGAFDNRSPWVTPHARTVGTPLSASARRPLFAAILRPPLRASRTSGRTRALRAP